MNASFRQTSTGASVTTSDRAIVDEVTRAAAIVGASVEIVHHANGVETVSTIGGSRWMTIPVPGGTLTIGR